MGLRKLSNYLFAIGLWLLAGVAPIAAATAASKAPADCEALIASASSDDLNFLKLLDKKGAETYLSLRQNANTYLANNPGANDFPFQPHKAILERVVADITQRLKSPLGLKFKAELTAVKSEALSLLKNGNPLYKKTVRFVMYKYLPTMDLLLFERHAHLKGLDFHKRNAEHLIEPLLAEAPDLFFYFSFEWLEDDFFTNTRPALMNLIGINTIGLDDSSDAPYADMYYMSISEFSYHDVGHAEFTSMRDLEYLKREKKPIERTVWEWEVTRQRVMQFIKSFEKNDPILNEALRTLLFELLRERGFQFSLTVLKQELETPKWTLVLKKKFERGFYNYYGTNADKFDRLEDARLLLVQAVNRFKERDQLNWLQATRAQIVPAKITHTPPLLFSQGLLDSIEIFASQPTRVHTINQSKKNISADIRDLISAQVDPTKNSPLTESAVQQIAMALEHPETTSVVIQADFSLWAKQGDQLYPLSALPFNAKPSVAPRRQLSNIEIFEINQVLGAHERSEPQSFTIRDQTQTYIGTVKVNKTPGSNSYSAKVKNLEGFTVTLPLSELRIDPL